MTKYSEFTRANVSELREDLNKELKLLGEKLGVSIGIGSMSYTSSDVTTKLTIATASNSGAPVEYVAERAKLERDFYFRSQGLKPDLEFSVFGVDYILLGKKSSKNLLARAIKTGKVYKIPVEAALDSVRK